MVVSVDRQSLEAIKTIEGEPEERQKLTAGTDGFCVCTWSDGSVYESKASVLFLTLKEKTATVDEKAEEEDSDSEGKKTEEEEEEEDEEEEEEEDAEEEEEDEEVEEPPSKKPKESKPEKNLEDLRTHSN